MVRGGSMYCKICGQKREGLRIFSIYMCKDCFDELVFVSVEDSKYDYYKNLIRILLSYYIGGKEQLNPVK